MGLTKLNPRVFDCEVDGLVNLKDYGAKGDGVTDDTAALVLAVARCKATGFGLFVPRGNYIVSNNTILDFKFNIYGEGRSNTIFTIKDTNKAHFTIALNGFSLEDCVCHDLGFAVQFTNPLADHSATAAFQFTGSANDLFQWSQFYNIGLYGVFCGFRNEITPFTTAFGLEGGVNWTQFRNILIKPTNGRYTTWGFRHTLGSGTGNEYISWTGAIGSITAPGAGFLFEGTGCVVGDIIIRGGQFGSGGFVGSRIVAYGAGTVYRQRLLIDSVQLDAGMTYFITGDAPGIDYSNIKVINNNVGGGVIMTSLPPLRNSQINGEEVSEWKLGKYLTFDTVGGVSVNVFSVTLATFSATRVEITVAGLLGGVNAGVVSQEFMIRADATVAHVTPMPARISDTNVWGITATVSGLLVTFTVTCTSAAPASIMDAQLEAKGGRFIATRL